MCAAIKTFGVDKKAALASVVCLDARFTYKANSGELVSEIQCEWCLSLQWGDTTTTGQMDQETEFLPGNRDLVRGLLFLAALEGYVLQTV